MLVVSVEVWPGGDIRRRRVIHTANLVNISDLTDYSDYECYMDSVRTHDVENHYRDIGAWDLIWKMLDQDREELPPPPATTDFSVRPTLEQCRDTLEQFVRSSQKVGPMPDYEYVESLIETVKGLIQIMPK